MRALVVVAMLAGVASADPKPLAAVHVRGDTKVTEVTATRLARLSLGDPVSPEVLPDIQAALISSELFKAVAVTLEETPEGYVLVATLTDKMSWIVAPAVYVLSSMWSVGVGYAENNLFGEDKKLLLYGQIGNENSLFFGTYLIPSVRGTPLMLRFDLYANHRIIDEYVNDPATPTSRAIARISTWTWLDPAVLVGWRWRWWLTSDVRVRPAYAAFSNVHDPSGAGLPAPEKDGLDTSAQGKVTLDRRQHRFGVSWGTYAQLYFETSVPGVSDFNFQVATFKFHQAWRLFEEHQFEIRTAGGLGRHMPFHNELTIGGVTDLRGYATDRFRGDRRWVYRAEYSFPIFRTHGVALRGIGFFDGGYVGFHWRDPDHRNYLATEADGSHWWANDAGGGIRVYIKQIVLPLLGLDVAYGIEGKRPELYFELGLTDF